MIKPLEGLPKKVFSKLPLRFTQVFFEDERTIDGFKFFFIEEHFQKVIFSFFFGKKSEEEL